MAVMRKGRCRDKEHALIGDPGCEVAQDLPILEREVVHVWPPIEEVCGARCTVSRGRSRPIPVPPTLRVAPLVGHRS